MSSLIIEASGNEVIVRIPAILPPYARGSAILATLAEPPRVSKDARTLNVYLSLCRLFLRHYELGDPDGFAQAQTIIPSHLAKSFDRAVSDTKSVPRRLEERMVAAHAAAPFIQEAERAANGQPAQVRRLPRVDSAVMATLDLEERRLEKLNSGAGGKVGRRVAADPDNVETRIVRQSLPVIHIAFAVSQAVDISVRHLAGQPSDQQKAFHADLHGPNLEVKHQIGVEHIQVIPELQDFIIKRSELIEPFLPHMRPLKPKQIVRLRVE